MTILILTEDAQQGEMLSRLLSEAAPSSLCLVMRPADAAATLREIQVDQVIGPADMAETGSSARFTPWPQGPLTVAWVQTLLKRH